MTIKTTAGKMLLYIYKVQRSTPLSMANRQLVFVDKLDKGVAMTSDKVWFAKDLLGINPKGTDVLNAFRYLLNKRYITSHGRHNASAKIYVGVELTATGVDVVESVEREDSDDFYQAFNIKAKSGIKVDDLVKDELSTLS